MMELNTSEKMLLALLKASLNEIPVDASYFQVSTEKDWKQCYQMAARQGVMALAWDGISTLPKELQVPRVLKLTWAMAVENYENRYSRYCHAIHDLSAFYAERGIKTIQLKGVGLSAYYPIPSHREGGDIDIYTCSDNLQKMTDAEANSLADKLVREQGIDVEMHSYKHSNFHYEGVPIENHKYFLNVKHYPVAVLVNDMLMKTLQPKPVELLDGECVVLTPSPAFNTLFLAFHASQHYGSGLALHHLCDWAMLVKRYGLQIPEELTDKRFLNAMAAFTQLCNRYLGTSVDVLEGKELADELMEEIMHPKFSHNRDVPVKGKWNILWYKMRRLLYISRISNRILYRPLWRRIWASVVSHINHPETIFKTKG